MKNRIKKIGTNLLKLGVSVAAIWYVMSKISFKEVLGVFSTANVYYLLGALVFAVLSFVFSAFRQNLSFRNTGANLSQRLNIKLFWLGMFYNLFLPGGIGGDGMKVYLVNKYRKNGLKKNIGTMLVNRISGLVAVGMITIVLYYLSGLHIEYGNAAWIGIPAVYILYIFVLKFFFKSFLKIHAGLFWWSVALQMMQFLSALFILFAFHQTTNLFDYLFLFFVSAIATAIPITIGGFGAREMFFLIGAKTMELNNELCIALSLMFFLISSFISLGGLYWVFFPPFRREVVPVQSPEENYELDELSE
ncbi:MAG: lysylphosphatidylglycerol synthase transmembrane domain-containing protein [Bacteroidia bacterium]|nr:lysylphosphatidylglycerol synthase transmembrane domain-containing protein [Bacteroidia bacterium]